MPKIDTAHYDIGRTSFNAGKSLRQVIEALADAARDEDEGFSALLGFADAALDKLRGIER